MYAPDCPPRLPYCHCLLVSLLGCSMHFILITAFSVTSLVGLATSAAAATANVQLSCSVYKGPPTGFQDFCTSVFSSDPIGVEASITRNPPSVSAYMEAVGVARAGHLGVQSISRLSPNFDNTLYSAVSFAQASFIDTIAVLSASSAGTTGAVIVTGSADFRVNTLRPSALNEFSSRYSAQLWWSAALKSYSPNSQLLGSVRLEGMYEADESDGSFTSIGLMSDTDELDVQVGGFVSITLRMTAQTFVSGVDWGVFDDVFRIDAETSSLNSLHVYLDAANPTFTLIGSNGYNYASPIPEPSALMLLLAALPLMSRFRLAKSE